MPWTLWGTNVAETQFSTNPEMSGLKCIRTNNHKANLEREAALFGSRWEYVQLKEAWKKHHKYTESAASQRSNSDHILNKVWMIR